MATKKPAAGKAAATTPPARPKVVAASTEDSVSKYQVTGSIRLGGVALEPGDEVELTELQAWRLAGYVEPLAADAQE
jgi:hypothetical protein